jgi:hypothetical protein
MNKSNPLELPNPMGRLLCELIKNENPREEFRNLVGIIQRDLEDQERLEFLRRAYVLLKVAFFPKDEENRINFSIVNLENEFGIVPPNISLPMFRFDLPERMIDLARDWKTGDLSDQGGDVQHVLCLRTGRQFSIRSQMSIEWKTEIPEDIDCTYLLFVTGPRAGSTWFWTRIPKPLLGNLSDIEGFKSVYCSRLGIENIGYQYEYMLILNEHCMKHCEQSLLTGEWLDNLKIYD